MSIQDCRTVKNTKIIDALKQQLDHKTLMASYGNNYKVNFERITLLINIKNTKENMIVIPILNKPLTRLIAETFITVEIEDLGTIDDVLTFTCQFMDSLEVRLTDFNVKPFAGNLPRYFSIDSLSDFFKPYLIFNSNDRLFYVIPPDNSSKGVYIGIETHEDGIPIQKFF